METPVENQPEEIKDKPEEKPAAKQQKKSASKKTATKKTEKAKLTHEMFNEIIRRNKEEGIPFHISCADFNVSESSFNYRRAKMRVTQNDQKQASKAESKVNASTEDATKVKELEQDCNYLRKEYMDLLLKYNRLLSKK